MNLVKTVLGFLFGYSVLTAGRHAYTEYRKDPSIGVWALALFIIFTGITPVIMVINAILSLVGWFVKPQSRQDTLPHVPISSKIKKGNHSCAKSSLFSL